MEKKRTLIFYKDYFNDFFNKLPEKVKGKIDEVLYILFVLERIPVKFFSHITGYDGLYEVRDSKKSLKRLLKKKLTKH